MSFNVVTSSFRVIRREREAGAEALRIGLIAGAAAVLFCLIGAYVALDKRDVVEGVASFAAVALAAIALVAGYRAATTAAGQGRTPRRTVLLAGGAGLAVGAGLALMVLATTHLGIRTILVAASPALVRALTFGTTAGSAGQIVLLLAAGFGLGALGGALATLVPERLRRAIIRGITVVIFAGLFRDVFFSIASNLPGGVDRMIYGSAGIRLWPALLLFAAVVAWTVLRATTGKPAAARTGGRSKVSIVLLVATVLVLPLITSDFVAQVAMLVALYMLMGMGLNIELGLAGLVDLGFVAFFAVGAYTVALLCSNGPLAIADVSFWVALPVAIVLAAVSGLVFGLPVLRVRGDYLAMATLGLGEIVRVLVLSDALAPVLGGSQGIIEIDRPVLAGITLNTPAELYYLALLLAGVVAFISWRLQHARIGRAWLAIREDEDVAQALGIDPVASKLVAYSVGAAFAGAAGAVFAVLVGSVFPHSFQLLVSINVLAILVIGGLGSLPGVLVGAMVLIGLPELLREFGEFRYLFYGVALVAMMHIRPEGLWPAESTKREMADA